MTRCLDADDLDALFTGATRSIVRVETLPAYVADDDDPAELGAYRREVRETVARGVVWERLRVIDTPLTDYQRWELGAYRGNQAAGETIHLVPRALAPSHATDLWLFDDTTAALMVYDPHGRTDRIEQPPSASTPHICRLVQRLRERGTLLEDYFAARGLAVRAS